MLVEPSVLEVTTTSGAPAWILDEVLSTNQLQTIDAIRTSLVLDSKRPTVDRRFFADGVKAENDEGTDSSAVATASKNAERTVGPMLEEVLRRHLLISKKCQCHVFQYMRFLEYWRIGNGMDLHTDGTKVCEDTGLRSTHTLLLYLARCETGGETKILLRNSDDFPNKDEMYAVQPRVGRILLFPHTTPHEGCPVQDVPKICLRAEVHLGKQE